mmetsp:Transcript_18565/g.44621  ORF Transcript_18565/g.44621 Transcript_18565/m.44621 type:complete len:259 (+) Transcript_18565:201-977(+)
MGCGASSQPNRAPDAVLPGEAAQSKGRTDFEPPLEPLRSPPTSGAALTNTGGEAMANPVLESRPPIPEEQNICSSKEIVGENKVLKERNCSCGARWSELDKHVVEWSEQVVKELVEKFERNLEEERQRRLHAESQKDMLITEHHEWIAQAEEDFDRELDGLREQYESKLSQERRMTIQLKGENGLMRKRFTAMQRASDDAKSELKAFSKRVEDLAKLNQELHQSKSVLEAKVEEQGREIERLRAAAEQAGPVDSTRTV